jgi:hypothetical protein
VFVHNLLIPGVLVTLGIFYYICFMAVFIGSLAKYKEKKELFETGEFGSYKEQQISDYGRLKTTTQSFKRYGSRGYIENPAFRAAYIDNSKGLPIDTIAKSITDRGGLEITPEDIVQFMQKYRGGVGNKQSKSKKTFYGAYNPDNTMPEYKKQYSKSKKAEKTLHPFDFEPEKKRIELIKYLPQRGTSDEKKDAARWAISPGKRMSKKGNIYWETRKNRSDDFITGIVKL